MQVLDSNAEHQITWITGVNQVALSFEVLVVQYEQRIIDLKCRY